MMGIAVDGSAYIFGNNKSILCNTTITDYTSRKKSKIIACHLVREGAARDEWRTSYVNMHENPTELLINVLSMSD